MKKFFKALALVLALTLVIGTIPASAAIDFSFKIKSKVLYIGGSNGSKTDEDGNVIKCKTKESYTLSKFINNFDSDTMRSKLESSNEAVVAIDGHKAVAKAIGTATVNVTILDKETKTDIGGTTLSIKIKVKKNATSIPYIVKDTEGNVIEDVANYKFAANTDYIFTLTRLDEDGNRVDTDKRNLECDSDKVSIKAGEAGIMYRVNFAEAGEYTLKASAFQSATFPNATAEAVEIKCKVGYEAVAVDQYSLNQAVVTFETNVANPNKDLFKLYTKVINNGEEKLLDDSQVKGVEVLADDKTKVVATFEADFVAGREYFLYYGEKEVGSFVAATVNADSVARIEIIPGQEFEVNKTGTLKYKLFNDKDVDITTAYGKSLNGTISAELVDKSDTTSNIWGLDVVLGKENTNYDVKITYSWYDSTGIAQSKDATGVIRCIPVKVFQRSDFKGVIGSSKAIIANGAINGECTDSLFAYGDADTQLQVAIGFTLDGKTTYDVIDGAGIHNNTNVYDSYKVTSASEKVVMVVSGYLLSATGEGSTNIVVYGTKANQPDQVVGVIPVTVNPRRALSNFTVKVSKLALNMAHAKDSIVFDLVATDQYGAEMTKDVTVEQIKAAAYTGPIAFTTGTLSTKAIAGTNNEITLTPADLNPNGPDDKTTLIFEFTCEGKKYRVSNIDCGYATVADRQLLDIQGESELKTGVTTSSSAKTTTIALKGLASNKYAVTGAAVSFLNAAPAIDRNNPNHRFVYTVKKDGAVLTSRPANFVDNTFTSVVKDTSKVASGSAVKLAAGTYTVDLYEFKTSSDGAFATPYMIDSASFKVTDDQGGLTFEKVQIEGLNKNLSTVADLAGCFKFKFDNNYVTDEVVIDATFAGDGSSAYVKSAKYTGYNAALGEFTVTVAIDLVVRR